MPVQTASGSSDAQRQRPLQNGGENLHLVGAAVFGYLKPLHQKLQAERQKGSILFNSVNPILTERILQEHLGVSSVDS